MSPLWLIPTLQQAQDFSGLLQPLPAVQGWRGFVQAWFGFTDWRLMVRLVVGLLVALLLAGAIAFHPRTWGRPTSMRESDQPLSLLIYAVIGAVVAQIVAVQPAMAFVVFGIGGLLRFRTIVGEADDTGQVILVTVVGVACGLHLFPLAALATAAGWMLLYVLRGSRTVAFDLTGPEGADLSLAMDAVRAALGEVDYVPVIERSQPTRGRIRVLARGPHRVPDATLERSLVEHLPSGIAMDWHE